MKSAKNVIAGFALITGLIGLAAPASAAWYHDRDFSRDRGELADARQELRHDLRRGAGHLGTALPSLVNGGKSGRTAGIGDMTAGTAIMITGRGIADNGLDGDLDLTSL